MWASNLALTALLVSLLGSVFAEAADFSESRATEKDDPDGKGLENERYDGYISNAALGNKYYKPKKADRINFSAVGVVRGTGQTVVLATARPGTSAYFRILPEIYKEIVFVAPPDVFDPVPVQALIVNRQLYGVTTIDTILNGYETKCGLRYRIFTNVLQEGDSQLFPVEGRDKDQ